MTRLQPGLALGFVTSLHPVQWVPLQIPFPDVFNASCFSYQRQCDLAQLWWWDPPGLCKEGVVNSASNTFLCVSAATSSLIFFYLEYMVRIQGKEMNELGKVMTANEGKVCLLALNKMVHQHLTPLTEGASLGTSSKPSKVKVYSEREQPDPLEASFNLDPVLNFSIYSQAIPDVDRWYSVTSPSSEPLIEVYA